MNFSQALAALKAGKKVARSGWNGKGQYIELATRISYVNADGDTINADHDAIGNKAIAFVGTSGVQLGWLASQADLLADDWELADGKPSERKNKTEGDFEEMLLKLFLLAALDGAMSKKGKKGEEPKPESESEGEPDCEDCPNKEACDELESLLFGKNKPSKKPAKPSEGKPSGKKKEGEE